MQFWVNDMKFKYPKRLLLSGMLHVIQHKDFLDIYNPNAPYAQAHMRIVDGKAKVIMNNGAPMHFRNEVQTQLDKLKTILILGG